MPGVDLDIGIHAVQQLVIGIGQLDTDLRGAGFGLQLGKNEGNLSPEYFSRIGTQGDFSRIANLDPANVHLGDIGNDPDGRNIGQPVELIARHGAGASDDRLAHQHAVNRRRPIHGKRDVALRRDGGNELFRNAEIAQLARSRLLLASSHCKPVVDQCLDDLRAVETEQRFTSLHMLARCPGIDFFDETLGPQRDRTLAPLVKLDRARRMDRFRQHAYLDRFGADTGALHLFDAHLDDGGIAGAFVGIDGDIVHLHRVLFGDRRCVGKAHGIAVVKNLRLARWRGSHGGGHIAADLG